MQRLPSRFSLVSLALLAGCTYDASKLTAPDAKGDDGAIDQQTTSYNDTAGGPESVILPDGGRDSAILAEAGRADTITVTDAGVDLPPASPDARIEADSIPDLSTVDVPATQTDGRAMQMDAASISDARLLDATTGYTSNGVTVFLGVNPCYTDYARAHPPATNDAMGGGWDPATNTCNTPAWPVMSGICGTKPACGTYAPGTLLIWDANDLKYRYRGDPSGGVVCLPNDTPYVVACS